MKIIGSIVISIDVDILLNSKIIVYQSLIIVKFTIELLLMNLQILLAFMLLFKILQAEVRIRVEYVLEI